MSALYETTPAIAGLFTRHNGIGVPGASVATSGEHGSGLMANDRALPADSAAELRIAMTSQPAGASLVSWTLGELGELEVEVSADGVVAWVYDLFSDGVALGAAPGSITVGAASGSLIPFAATFYHG